MRTCSATRYWGPASLRWERDTRSAGRPRRPSAGAASIGIDSGIVLSSGEPRGRGPNSIDSGTGFASLQGDADLDAEFGFVPGGLLATEDTTYLQFGFQLDPNAARICTSISCLPPKSTTSLRTRVQRRVRLLHGRPKHRLHSGHDDADIDQHDQRRKSLGSIRRIRSTTTTTASSTTAVPEPVRYDGFTWSSPPRRWASGLGPHHQDGDFRRVRLRNWIRPSSCSWAASPTSRWAHPGSRRLAWLATAAEHPRSKRGHGGRTGDGQRHDDRHQRQPATAQYLGTLAPDEKSADDNRGGWA